jgi:predicted Zn-dependent protease
MLNVLMSLVVGLVVFAGLYFTHLLRLGEAIVPGVIAMLAALFILGRRVFKELEGIFEQAGKDLQNQRFDAALQTLKSAFSLTKRQFGVASQLNSQIGMILYLRKDFNGAIPYLEQSRRFGHWMALAMLAVAYYKKKDNKRMRETFDLLVSRAKKQGLAWNLYAYCLTQIGEQAEAQAVLARGDVATKDDKRVKENLLALQNGKKLKMKGYAEQWYQFHLEAPPVQMLDGRSQFSARRRR